MRGERLKKKENVVFVPLNASPIRDALQSLFFFGFTEVVCAYIHCRSVRGCVCSLVLLFATLYSCRLHYSMCVFYYYFLNLINYHLGLINSWLIGQNLYQQSIADNVLIVDNDVLINKEPY
jgi:hypothetical protein